MMAICALGVVGDDGPVQFLSEQQQRIQRPSIVLGGSLVASWRHPKMRLREDSCVNTVRLDLYGQGCRAIRPLSPGDLVEERCWWVSTRQRPIGEGWENSELRLELVVSSRALGLAACEGNRHGSDVVAASIADVRW